ncbi:MAG: outer membrane protein assembly factor BamA [Thermodesulfobacteriota bacterium]
MRSRVIVIAALMLIPMLAQGQEQQTKKALVLPVKVIGEQTEPRFSNELAGALATRLSAEGDAEVIPAPALKSLFEPKTPDWKRIARVVKRQEFLAAVCGTVTKQAEGYSLEIAVVGQDESQKPKLFFANATSMDDLTGQLDDLVAQIGKEVFGRPTIGNIKIEGNRRIDKNAILNKMSVKPGDTFRRAAIAEQIRSVYDLGYFEDVQIRAEKAEQDKVELVVDVKERPSIKAIEIEGNTVFTTDKLLDELTTKSLNVVSIQKMKADIEKLKKLYEKEGYYETDIEFAVKELSRNEAKLVFTIREGAKSYLVHLVFDGRKSIDETELKRVLGVKEKSWFWFIDESGKFTRDLLEENRLRLMAFYREKGFISVQVGPPHLEIDQGRATVTFSINEGERFQVREVKITGDLEKPEDELLAMLKTKPRKWFKQSEWVDDVKTLTKLYNNLGYAQVDVEPRQNVDTKLSYVDLEFQIHKGSPVRIERVDISGNERTRDKVIRRALSVREGDRFSADALDASKKDLEGMDFFDTVKLKTIEGSTPDRMNLTVEVSEKKTGSLTAGVGYSSQEGAVGNIDLKERNLLGLGIIANAKANMSGKRNSYEGSLTYPYFFDYLLSAQVRAYDTQQAQKQYTRSSTGFGVNLSYPIYGLWGLHGGFARDSSKMTNFQTGYGASVVDYYRQYNANPGKFSDISENSLALSLNRDTRNHGMLPTAGTTAHLRSRFAGLGGDVAYNKFDIEGSYYYSLYWRTVAKVRGSAAMLQESGNEPIPLDRRLSLGGVYSIRGYQNGAVGPMDRFGNVMGGDRSAFVSVECLRPLVDALKLNGVVFFDVGNAWNASQSAFMPSVKAGVGFGVRWLSPMGPLRIEYGWKINPQKGEEPGAFAFAMGQLF